MPIVIFSKVFSANFATGRLKDTKGFTNNNATKTEAVSISRIFSLLNSGKISSNQDITKQILKDLGLIKSTKSLIKLIM